MDLIKQFILDNIWYFVALFAGGTTFLVPMTKEIWIIILRAMISRKAIIRVFIHFGDYLVTLIPGTVDNELWAEAKKALIEELKK
jgi:hypothetical protein